MPRTKNIKELPCNARMCKTCMFHPNQKTVTPARFGEIQCYLINGTSHICHTTNNICRGARNFQLTIFYRLGLLDEPTDACLNQKLKDLGIKKS